VVKGITRNRRIIGWAIIFVGAVYIVNGFDHLFNDSDFFDRLWFELLSSIGLDQFSILESNAGFLIQIVENSPTAEIGAFLFSSIFVIFNLDYIPLFIIGIVLILLSRKIIFKIPFRGKKNG